MKLRTMSLLLALLVLVLVVMPHRSDGRSLAALPSHNLPETSGVILPAPMMSGNAAGSIDGSAADAFCFYRQTDGTVIDLSAICGDGAAALPLLERPVPNSSGALAPRSSELNPAMQITPPNDPGVLYLSGSGGPDAAAQAASQDEQQPTR
jgi:hypothetical protein